MRTATFIFKALVPMWNRIERLSVEGLGAFAKIEHKERHRPIILLPTKDLALKSKI